MALDQSLDDIISTKKKTSTRGGRGSGQKRGAGARGGAAGAAVKPRAAKPNQAAQAVPVIPSAARLPVGDKIVVSNLPDDVTEQQVRVSERFKRFKTTWAHPSPLNVDQHSHANVSVPPFHVPVIGALHFHCWTLVECQLGLQLERSLNWSCNCRLSQANRRQQGLRHLQWASYRWKCVYLTLSLGSSVFLPLSPASIGGYFDFLSSPLPLLILRGALVGCRRVDDGLLSMVIRSLGCPRSSDKRPGCRQADRQAGRQAERKSSWGEGDGQGN